MIPKTYIWRSIFNKFWREPLKFFSHGQNCKCPEPDLVIDEELDAHKSTVRRRQTAQDEENVARRFLIWSLNRGKSPSFTFSGNAFSNYLKDVCGSTTFDFLKEENLLGKFDVMTLTKNRGLFVSEVKSTWKGNMWIYEDAQKAWYQTLKDKYVFKALNSDLEFVEKIPVHNLVVFPNLTKTSLQPVLCDRHFGSCIFQETFSQQDLFEEFLEKYLEKKGLESGYTPFLMTTQNYKTLAARQISLCTAIEGPRKVQDIGDKTSQKISKLGSMLNFMTPQQKEILDSFSMKNGKLPKLKITGHFGTGKTWILLLGMNKLYRHLQKRKDEKHVIIFSSLGCVNEKGEPGYRFEESYLNSIKSYVHGFTDCNTDNVIFEVSPLITGLMKPMGLYLSCDECRKNKKRCKCDPWEDESREAGSLVPVTNSLLLRVSDLINVLNAFKDKYQVPYDNVHLFLDEVSSLGQDWTDFDSFAAKYKNVIWLSLNSQFYFDLQSQMKMKSFEEKSLDFVLRNTKLICSLTNEIKKYNVLNSDFENKCNPSKAFNIKEHIVPVGHSVDGLIPRVLIMPPCTCKFYRRQAFQFCQCIVKRLEEALKESISHMFGFRKCKTLNEVCQNLKNDVHIITQCQEASLASLALQQIMKKNNIAHYSQLERSSNYKTTMMYSNNADMCKIHLVDVETVLGHEFDNVIFIGANLHKYDIHPQTGDISNFGFLHAVSRSRSQFHLITFSGKEMNRWWDYNQGEWYQLTNHIEQQGDVSVLDEQNTKMDQASLKYETVGLNLIPHLLSKGFLLLLPLSEQKQFGLDQAKKLWMTGRSLLVKLKEIKEEGNVTFKSKDFKRALTKYVIAIDHLQKRLPGKTLSTDPLETKGIAFQMEEIQLYHSEIKILRRELFINSGVCLFRMANYEGALNVKCLRLGNRRIPK